MNDCLFCKIIAGEIPSEKVYEDELCYAFHDISRMAPVHFLVVPKQHYASAAEIKEVVALIEEYHIPAIFVEKNGSSATAEVIARETGCEIYELDMLMSGEGTGLPPYFDAMEANRAAIKEALK